jgi:DNA-binding CsgD family transcriptional regulator
VLKIRNIAIITPNTMLGLGCQLLLIDFFNPDRIHVFSNLNELLNHNEPFEYIFLTSDIYISQYDYFQPLKNRLIIITEGKTVAGSHSSIFTLDTTLTVSDLVETLQNFFASKNKKANFADTEDLSRREIEVLKQVTIGQINKEIADTLNISLHTVISHRKNITRKLGIKTVSGLTVYAILNGLISTGDIE